MNSEDPSYFIIFFFFGSSFLGQLLGISELFNSRKYYWVWFFFFFFHEFHRLTFGFHKVSASLWVGFCSIFQALFLWELEHKAWSEIVLCALVWFCFWCSGLCLWMQSAEVTLLNNEFRIERKICVVSFPPSCILWLFLRIFWQVLSVSRCATSAVDFCFV